MVKRVLNTYYGIIFIFELALSFFFSIYAIFLVSHGLSLFEVNLVNCVFMLGCFVFEVPTGAFADGLGRKQSFIISCFTMSLSLLVYYLSSTIAGFMLAELIAALAITFHSGAFEAWMIDSVKYYDKGYDLDPVYRRSTQILQLGRIVGVISGAYVAQINLALPWLYSSIGMFIVGFVSIFIIKEEYWQTEKGFKALPAIMQIGRDSIKYGFKEKGVLFIIVVSLLFSFTCMPLNMFWQLRYTEDFLLPVKSMGYIHAGALFVMMLGAWLVRYKYLLRTEKHAILTTLILFVVGIIVASLDASLYLVLSGYLLHEISRGLYVPLKSAYINSRIPSRVRATILSFEGMMGKLGALLGLLVSGIIAETFSVRISWLSVATVMILAIPFLFFARNGE